MFRKIYSSLGWIDRLTLPFFVLTMLCERRALRDRVTRHPSDMGDTEERSPDQPPPDPLVPVGYERRDTAASLAMLTGNVVLRFVTLGALLRFDGFLFRHRISRFGSRRGSFATAMVLWDFLYYWDHRWMHEVRLLWANHVNHHSSERYNLSTALRQPWSGFLTAWVFAPMPLLGYPSATIARAAQWNLLYQYWIHTETVDRLATPLERALNTPSHHRVHHGSNEQYLDKNYGGILIAWDKVFGTFEPELRRVRYGLTKNIDTFNPLRIAYHEFAAIAGDVRRSTSWSQRARHVFGRPGWQPAARAGSTYR